MSASAFSVALIGTEGTIVEVEAAVGAGLPRTVLVGLPDSALYEARDRCKPAVQASGLPWPEHLLTINLTPAALPKAGTHYDLAIAAAVLAAGRHVPPESTSNTVMMGELKLDGRVQAVRGVLPALVTALHAGMTRAIVPANQLAEARLVDGMTVWGVSTLSDLVDVLHGRPISEPTVPPAEPNPEPTPELDLSEVAGQHEARWALEVAAAGRHHLYLQGPPGVGKTMLASRLPSILPDLSPAESLEVSMIRSLLGELGDGLVTRPPFCDPHHSASLSAMVGGGPRVARPGCISMAHRGVLFLDEAPEFATNVLDALRTPLESGWVNIARAQLTTRFPARFQLVIASNPCKCGQHGVAEGKCRCSPNDARRYLERLSGPILDRVDLQQHLLPPSRASLTAAGTGESSAVVADRVREARQRQARRLAPLGFRCNGDVPGSVLRSTLPVPRGIELLDHALIRGHVTSRGVDKVLRVAWTIADLAGSDRVERKHLQTALAMRQGELIGAAA